MLLQVDRLCSGYGRIPALHDIDIAVPAGAIVALVGPTVPARARCSMPFPACSR